ncbi:ABC transporter permease [Natronospora cellulosivora (SeqCode)]
MAEKSKRPESQGQLIWRDFKKHRVANIGLIILIIMYTLAIFANFITPYQPRERFTQFATMPPSRIHIRDENGFRRPFVYGYTSERDPMTLARVFTIDEDKKLPIQFFLRGGEEYSFLGLFNTDLRLFGVEDGQIFLFGTDEQGRDLFSRTIHGARLSLSIGLVGVIMSLILGLIIGGISGYFGGALDNIIQRLIEFLLTLPTIPVWMALAVALPPNWSMVQVYFAITVIISLISWAGLARVIRSQVISLREQDFVKAAQSFGAGAPRIIIKHLLPNCMSYILVTITLAVPGMILAETALSFLGLGLRAPAVSWGVLLMSAQNVRALANYPWLFIPAVFVVVTVLAFNFVGDGVRDAVDPYH